MKTTITAPSVALFALASVLLGGCVTTGNYVSDWGEITLAPGDTGVCQSNPCRVFFEMPPGQGNYRVRGTAFDIGEYPAGKKAMIGSFFESSVIDVVGAGVPRAYIYVPNTSSDVN